MEDPIASVAAAVLAEVAKGIKDLLEQIHKFQELSVERCQIYLKAARLSVNALEDEYINILLQAKRCDPLKKYDLESLDTRIDDYLYGENIRPLLGGAIFGLTPYLDAFDKQANRFLNWPWRISDRQKAVADFAALLQKLFNYHKTLDEDLVGPSGVNVPTLQIFQRHIELQLGKARQKPRPDALVPDQLLNDEYIHLGLQDAESQKEYFLFEFASAELRVRSTQRQLDIGDKIMRLIEKLRLAFAQPL